MPTQTFPRHPNKLTQTHKTPCKFKREFDSFTQQKTLYLKSQILHQSQNAFATGSAHIKVDESIPGGVFGNKRKCEQLASFIKVRCEDGLH
ncbi:hypothetical protein CEXT_661581 [Caerostris extrusa]|uniref:Uncharacterized protein n=1 Tax=Caerostris extrusa TaxID=172846 RepID=A0AAV4PM06_CAEEX|nr:hypothetical protein CEXT_661581 [Caerostris extrusa]